MPQLSSSSKGKLAGLPVPNVSLTDPSERNHELRSAAEHVAFLLRPSPSSPNASPLLLKPSHHQHTTTTLPHRLPRHPSRKVRSLQRKKRSVFVFIRAFASGRDQFGIDKLTSNRYYLFPLFLSPLCWFMCVDDGRCRTWRTIGQEVIIPCGSGTRSETGDT
jgi:hypothetical protein